MTHDKIQRLLERRAYWIAQSELQRDLVAQESQRLVVPTLQQVDKLRDAASWLRQRPWLLGAGLATAVVLRPRRAWRWLRRGWSVWRLWQRLRPLLDRV
jgi:hypothetical protein